MEESLEIGIKVLAMIHSGKITQRCLGCDTFTQDSFSCGSLSEDVVYEDEEIGELNTCPIMYITKYINDFYDEYSYYETFTGTAPKYGEHNIRFWEACKLYKSTYNKYLYDDKKTTETDTDSELKKMKANFDRNKKHKR
jgi:hypothetical protein